MAITSVAQRPHWISTPVNPMIYSVDSDKNEELDMFYVFDLYVNGSATRTHRIKQRPNPAGFGMIDISSIMSTHINLSDWAPAEFDYTTGTNVIKDYDGIIAQVEVYVGEEYLVDGLPTLFDGSGTAGDPAYELASSENNETPNVNAKWPIVVPGALSYQEGVESLSDQSTQIPYWQKYAQLDTTGYGYALSDVPLNATWNKFVLGDFITLSYLNQNPFYVDNVSGQIYLWTIKAYENGNGTPLQTNIVYNITGNGGGPATTTGYSSVTFNDPEYFFLNTQFNPGTLWTAPAGMDYFTVTPTTKDSGGSFEGQTYYFYVDPDCQDLYQRVRLSWLNKWGGRDYYNFTKFYEKSTNTTSDSYSQSNYNWSGTTPVVGSGFQNKTNNWNKGGTKSFNRNTEITMRIESDWVVQEELDYLGAIPESPDVIAYVGDTVPAKTPAASPEEIPYTVQITNLKYEYKLIKQQKLTQVSFDMTYTKLDKKQDIV